MRVACALLVAVAACGPQTGSGSETAAATSGTGGTTTPTTTGGTSTTAATTTGDTSGDGTTTGSSDDSTLNLCPWDSFDGQVFCPLLAAPNIAIAGDSPLGPVKFEYAYFGLFRCGSCPYPDEPALGLFAQPQQSGLTPFVGDFIVFLGVHDGNQGNAAGQIGGVALDFNIDDGLPIPQFSGVVLVTEEQMETMPLDPAAPPTIGGNLTIDGESWAVAGAFTASLCTTLDRIASCS